MVSSMTSMQNQALQICDVIPNEVRDLLLKFPMPSPLFFLRRGAGQSLCDCEAIDAPGFAVAATTY
jgi:hypothetical protein